MQSHDFSRSYECPVTNEAVPEDFFEFESLYLLNIGFSRHGKTVFLSALTLILEQISTVWRRVTLDCLDEYTRRAVYTMRYLDRRNQQPNLTQAGTPRPLFMRINNLPKLGTRNLVLYDVGGELFTNPESLDEFIPVLSAVNTCWFFISLEDLYTGENVNTLGDLFAAYRKAMNQLGAPLEDRDLIVVYTKADEVTFHDAIDHYIQDDPLRDLTNHLAEQLPTPADFDWDVYIDAMQAQSHALRDYTMNKLRGGSAFIDRAEDAGMRLQFSAVSALGAGVDEHTHEMTQNAQRYRVLDPFLGAVLAEIRREEAHEPDSRKSSTPATSPARALPLTLVFDASAGSRSLFTSGLPEKLAASLGGARGAVQTYFLGQSKIAARAGQPPPQQPPKTSRSRLIGPVFDALAKEAGGDTLPPVVVVAGGPILDLNDYRGTAWAERALFVVPEANGGDDWDEFAYTDAADLNALVMAIRRKYGLKR
jgi:hypothetical protein